MDQKQDLEIALGVVNADHVEIALQEFAVAAFLRLFATPDLGHVIALEGEGKLAVVGSNIAGKGNGQVESERDIASAVVLEAEHLLVGFSAALAEENLSVLQCRGIDGNESEGAQDALDLGHESLSDNLLLGKAVSESFQYFGLYHIHLIRPVKAGSVLSFSTKFVVIHSIQITELFNGNRYVNQI